MPALFFTCPSTNQRGPTGIQADVKSLRKSWSKTVTVNCSLCGRVHKFAVRELYTESRGNGHAPSRLDPPGACHATAISGARADADVLGDSSRRVGRTSADITCSDDISSLQAEAPMTGGNAPNGNIGVLLGVLVAIVAVVLLLNSGGYFGKTTIRGDADLPPVASGRR